MLEYKEVMESIRVLREKLQAVNREKKSLKEELRAKQGAIDSRVRKLKSAGDDERFVQKLLYSHLGAVTVKKDNDIEVLFKPYCSGVLQGKYVMVLQTEGKNSWKVAGYNLPLSVSRRQGINIQSTKELSEFVCEVSNEVHAYAERKYQATKTEELFKNVDASIRYTTKFQRIFLTLPMTLDDGQEKTRCEIELNYKVSDILPFQVTTSVSGLDEAKMKKLRKRLTTLLQHFPLINVMKEEYENDSQEESILGNLSP